MQSTNNSSHHSHDQLCVILDCRDICSPKSVASASTVGQAEMLGMASGTNYNAIATAVSDMI